MRFEIGKNKGTKRINMINSTDTTDTTKVKKAKKARKPSRLRLLFLTAAGILLLAIGAVGIVVPIWPTTPFVLCAVGCFSGNPALRARILKIKFVREYYENYQTRGGLSKPTVIKGLAFLWVTLTISFFFAGLLWLKLLLFFVGAAVTLHILIMARAKKV